MHHFFVCPEQVKGQVIEIEGADVNHIKNVLRIKIEEQIKISDGNNNSYICRVSSIEKDCIKAAIEEIKEVHTELNNRLYLFQGLPKSDKMELIIQKAVELGVYEIIPVMTKRSVVKLDDKKSAKKVERWNQISESAAKQSGRGIIPRVMNVMTYQDALLYAKELDVKLIPYELAEGMAATKEIIGAVTPGQSVAVFIGPEGGFEKEEVEKALAGGASEITLGKRILRTETAGLAVLSILMYHLEM